MMADRTLPFTQEMVVVHRAFRREFTQGPAWVRRVAPGDTAQAARVHGHLTSVFDTLHRHHEGEDAELWPRLRARASDHAALLDTMEAQHSGIDPALATAREAGSRWAATADIESREAFAAAIEAMAPALLAHLDQEEAEILPLAREHLSLEEWNLLGEHAVSHTPKRELLLGFGGILEDATPAERTMMLGVLPLPGRVMYRLYGRRAYVKQATAIRGTAPVGL